MVMIIALFYAAIFMCQKANLQANVQNALIYYKNVDSDNYIEAKSNMSYSSNNGIVGAVGSSYGTPQYKFPYRFLFMPFDSNGFKSFFKSMSKHMFFDDGDDVTIDVEKKNYVIYKTITATAHQTVTPAINIAWVGGKNSLDIYATGTVVVTDSDDFIRNIDFVIDTVNQTSFGQKVSEWVDKGVEYYNKFKTKFNVKDT
jgi:hypothetical protein